MTNLEKAIKSTITDTRESKSDFVAIMKLVRNGREQSAFNKWLLEQINKKGKNGWWKPMCLFRSYNLQREVPDVVESDKIRAEIRAVIDSSCSFSSGALNRKNNKEIYAGWKLKNEKLIQETFLKNSNDNSDSTPQNFLPESIELNQEVKYFEGSVKEIAVNSYERDLNARQKCIDANGLNCAICGCNFENRYGIIGKGFINVHHLKPLSEIRKEYEIDPKKDLCPLCPNCHAMVHQRTPPYTIEEVRKMISNANEK